MLLPCSAANVAWFHSPTLTSKEKLKNVIVTIEVDFFIFQVSCLSHREEMALFVFYDTTHLNLRDLYYLHWHICVLSFPSLLKL